MEKKYTKYFTWNGGEEGKSINVYPALWGVEEKEEMDEDESGQYHRQPWDEKKLKTNPKEKNIRAWGSWKKKTQERHFLEVEKNSTQIFKELEISAVIIMS